MIEIRLRAAASNPSSRKWRRLLSLATLAVVTVAPVLTSRAQDVTWGTNAADSEGLKGKSVTIEGGRTVTIDAAENISITAGASSITMRKDGTIVIKGTEIILDGPRRTAGKPDDSMGNRRASVMSEIF